MKTPLDSALADAQGIIADLKRQLAEGAAEREEALAQQTIASKSYQHMANEATLPDAVVAPGARATARW